MRLYHRTTAEAAREIVATGTWHSKEARQPVYFSNRRNGHADGYGETVVEVEVPEHLATIDDEFPDGEEHYVINADRLRPEHVTRIHERQP